MSDWIQLLQAQVEQKGRPVVQKELGISPTALSLVLAGRYPASTENIEKRVMAIYGKNGEVVCPVLGQIQPSRCVENFQRAQKINSAGNPNTIRLYHRCRKCNFRN